MKMKHEHFKELENAIVPIMNIIPLDAYKDAGLTEKRYRWDLCHKANLGNFICRTLYPYLNDDHIDTALRKITNTN